MENNLLPNGINPKELTRETYLEYCELYLIDKIYAVIPITVPLSYNNVSKLIGCINTHLFLTLNTETSKLLLLNRIYTLFMEAGNFELSKEFLYELVKNLDVSNYNPKLYLSDEDE